MNGRLPRAVLATLIGAYWLAVAPGVVLADDCANAGDCYNTVGSASTALGLLSLGLALLWATASGSRRSDVQGPPEQRPDRFLSFLMVLAFLIFFGMYMLLRWAFGG